MYTEMLSMVIYHDHVAMMKLTSAIRVPKSLEQNTQCQACQSECVQKPLWIEW